MNIIAMLERPDLFGAVPAFRDLSSWRNWLAILKALDGLPLSAAERGIVERFTGRRDFTPQSVAQRIIFAVGRQAAKTQMTATLGCHAGLIHGGPGLFVVLLAQDRTSALRALYGYVRELFNSSSVLRGEITRETADTLELRNGCTIAVYPARAASLRGIRAVFVGMDELAFASAGPDGVDRGRELIVAAEPCTATTNGRVVLLSSPGRPHDHFFSLVADNYGREGAEWLTVRAAAPDLNPKLGDVNNPEASPYLRRLKADRLAWRSEVMGEWNLSSSQLFDPAAIRAVTVAGRREIAPADCPAPVRIHLDPSGGSVDPAAAVAAYRDPTSSRVVIAALRSFPAPHNPAAVARSVAELARAYRAKVSVDRFGGQAIVGMLTEAGCTAEVRGVSASDDLLDLLPIVQSGGIELPDGSLSRTAQQLADELLAVERRPGGAGRDRVELPRGARHAGHCDLAASLASVVAQLPRAKERPKFAMPAIVPLRASWTPWAGGLDGGFVNPATDTD